MSSILPSPPPAGPGAGSKAAGRLGHEATARTDHYVLRPPELPVRPRRVPRIILHPMVEEIIDQVPEWLSGYRQVERQSWYAVRLCFITDRIDYLGGVMNNPPVPGRSRRDCVPKRST